MIAIVTDSTAYLTKQEAKELGVCYIPMTYTVNDSVYTEGFIDMFDFDKSALAINNINTTSTSQPVMSQIRQCFASLRAANCEVLCITLSARLSGTYSNASICARELGGNGICIIDSKNAAGGLAIMVKEARRLINNGKNLEETLEALEPMRDQIYTYFSVCDLAPLRRSGRLGFVRQSIGTLLNQRPIFTCCDGAVDCCAIARGSNEQIRRLVDFVPADAAEITVQCLKEFNTVSRIMEMLQKKCLQTVSLRKIGPVLGIHLGMDVVGISWRQPI